MPIRAQVAIIGRSSNRLARISIQALGISRVILILENMNKSMGYIRNIFASRKRLLPMPRELLTEKTRFLAKKKRD